MAILYGTQSNGETLPVLVDQFGNLLAKGIEGQQGPIGPEGPPGVGELPPNPFEGAILGWEDGELAWLSGSIILPAGTYGPYTYDSDSQLLDIPQDASALLNGQQLFMSDDKGIQVGIEIATDLISNVRGVANPILTFPSSNNFDKFAAGDVVYEGNWNRSREWSAPPIFDDNGYGDWAEPITTLFSGVIASGTNSVLPDSGGTFTLSFDDFSSATKVRLYYFRKGTNVLKINGEFVTLAGAPDKSSDQEFTVSGLTSIDWLFVDQSNYCYMRGIEVDGKLLVDSSVPASANPDAAKIIFIDEAISTITTDGGSWKGTDGSGDQSNGSPDIRKISSGDGSVATGLNGAIVLRADNGEWIDGYYVTAPEQQIAVRKVALSAVRRKTK